MDNVGRARYPTRTSVCLAPTVGGGVLDAPRSRDRRGRLAADVERDRWHPCFPRHARLRSPSSVCNPAGTARAPFCETWRSELSLPVDRRRGVGDAAPYGRLRNVGISISVNSCAKATASTHALGSPERGAVAALCAVTEGLAQRGWGAITLSVNRQRRTGDGAPYDVWGTFPHRNYTVRYPTQGASGTPPPTVVACGYVSAEP